MALSSFIRDVRPTRGILPDLLQQRAVDAAAFGDRQFLFRYLALQIQNAGDNGGRVTPLRDYDYDKVVAWLDLLDDLDEITHWPIAMANGYFGQTPETEDVRPVVRYMQAHVAEDPRRKWPWLVNGIYLARHRLKDNWVALDLAYQLHHYDFAEMNAVSLQMPALVLDDLEQYTRAVGEMLALENRRGGEFSIEERRWIDDFVTAAQTRSQVRQERN